MGGLKEKRAALRRLINSEEVRNALIFCNRKRDVGVVHRSLVRHGYDAGLLHGDLVQSQRTDVLERFKAGDLRLLCAATSPPGGSISRHEPCVQLRRADHPEDYVHRIGRTGRAGLSGRSFMLAAPEDGKAVAAIVKLIGKEIPECEIDGVATAALEYEERDRRRPRRAAAARGRPGDDAVPHSRSTPAKSSRDGPRRSAQRASKGDNRGAATVTQFPRRPRSSVPDPEGDRPIVGFGDHLPAFLARPPRATAQP